MISGNDTLRAVLVGCGGISGAWFNPLKDMPQVKLVGLVDLVEESAHKRAVEFGLPDAVISTDLEMTLSQLQPDIVFNCTVPAAHYATTLTALQHGCHILGEKPLADSMESAREMVAAAVTSGKIFAVMQNRRYLEPVRRIRQFVEGDSLGQLTTVNCDFYLGPHFGGFRDQMAHVLLMDMAIHTFDQARFMTHLDPVSVFCKEWNPPGSWYAQDASAVAIFTMVDPKTGEEVIFTYRGSWCAEGLPTSWESEWRVVCVNGTLQWDGAGEMIAETALHTGEFMSAKEIVAIPPYTTDDLFQGHASCIREFVESLQIGAIPNTICTDNIKSLSMVFAAIESAETGKVIKIGNS